MLTARGAQVPAGGVRGPSGPANAAGGFFFPGAGAGRGRGGGAGGLRGAAGGGGLTARTRSVRWAGAEHWLRRWVNAASSRCRAAHAGAAQGAGHSTECGNMVRSAAAISPGASAAASGTSAPRPDVLGTPLVWDEPSPLPLHSRPPRRSDGAALGAAPADCRPRASATAPMHSTRMAFRPFRPSPRGVIAIVVRRGWLGKPGAPRAFSVLAFNAGPAGVAAGVAGAARTTPCVGRRRGPGGPAS